MNLRHPFLIYGLYKNARVPLEDNEAWIHPIKSMIVTKDKSGVPQSEAVYDSGHEPSDEEELTTYQTLFGMHEDTPGKASQQSTTPPPPPPPPMEPVVPSPSPTLEDKVQDFTSKFDVFWDETQERQVTLIQDMDALRADMRTVLSNQQVIQQQLAQLLAFHLPPSPP